MKALAIAALAATLTVAAPAAAQAGGYTLPDGTRHTSTRAPHQVDRTPVRVTVHRGDTLWGLSARYRGTGHQWRAIARMNGIQGTTIYVGQVLRVR